MPRQLRVGGMLDTLAEIPLTIPVPELDFSTRQERRFFREVEAWLQEYSLPDGVVLWLPHWSLQNCVEVEDIAHLHRLIAAVEIGDWGGIRKSGDGRWAQAKVMPDRSTLLELHPYAHNRASLPFIWDAFPDLSAGQAASRAWRWLQAIAA